MEKETVSGIAYSRDEAKITVRRVPDRPGIAATIFGELSTQNVNVDMIVQNLAADGTTDMTFTVGKADLPRARPRWTAPRAIGYAELLADPNVAKISVVGVGMRSHAGVANTCSARWPTRAINIQVISTSEIKVSVLIARGIHGTGGARAAYRLRSRCRLTLRRPDPAPHRGPAELDRLWARGAAFLGCRFAIMGGAMSWVSERHLVAAISNAGGFGVIACGSMNPRTAGGRDRRHPGAHRPAVRRQPDHHASAARRSRAGLPGSQGRPHRTGRRHPARHARSAR